MNLQIENDIEPLSQIKLHHVKTNPSVIYYLITEVLDRLPLLTQLKLSGIDVGANTLFGGKTVVDVLLESLEMHNDTLETLDLADAKL